MEEKVKKHAAKRKANNPAPATDKRRKVDEASLEKSSPGRKTDCSLTPMKEK